MKNPRVVRAYRTRIFTFNGCAKGEHPPVIQEYMQHVRRRYI